MSRVRHIGAEGQGLLGMFSGPALAVQPITPDMAGGLVERCHYKHQMPGCAEYCYGLVDADGFIVAAIVYGPPPSPQTANSVAQEEYRHMVIELSRLVVDDHVADRKNLASRLVGGSLAMLPAPHIVVSYADSAEGHIGTVYQATNFLYAGVSTAHDSLYETPEGVLHPRTLASRGITAPTVWAAQMGYATIAPLPKHRYIYLVGSRRQKPAMARALLWTVGVPYPKATVEIPA